MSPESADAADPEEPREPGEPGEPREADRRRPRWVYGVGDEPDARWTLANERTLLAWLRTALALVITGLAAVTFRGVIDDRAVTRGVGVGACTLGAALAVAAYLRWGRVEVAMRMRRPLPAPGAALFVVAAVAGLAGLAVVLALVG